MKKPGKDSSLFQLIDQKTFQVLVDKWYMDKWAQGFKTWEMTCALISAMMMRLSTYREIEFALGIPKSTLGDAMKKRCYGFFEDLCDQTLLSIRRQTKDRKIKRAVREILALDSSEIRVHGSLFKYPNWLQMTVSKTSDLHVAAAKLHIVWNVDGCWVEDHRVTGGHRHDSPVANLFQLQENKIYVFDRAYCDLTLWLNIEKAGSHFVTRLKETFLPDHVRTLMNTKSSGVLYDGLYLPSDISMRRRKIPIEDRVDIQYRLVIYRDPVSNKTFYFVTSDFKLSAITIATIYKKRWAVELCFRWFKGHLDVRRLASKTTNSVKVQLAIAILVQLLLQLKKIVTSFSGTLSELLYRIRASLVYKSLCTICPPPGCRWAAASRAKHQELIL